MKQFSYVSVDGTFDYARYRRAQIAGNKAKINVQWAQEHNIAFLSGYIMGTLGRPAFGLCHGTRGGAEQAWFTKHLNCPVLGTEISDTASDFAETIQWDFHEVKPEWLRSVDFIYSNSWDHSYDPVKLFTAWMSCLKPNGLCFLEHTPSHTYADETDPLGMTLEELVDLLTELGHHRWQVMEILQDGPMTGAKGMQAPATHLVVRSN